MNLPYVAMLRRQVSILIVMFFSSVAFAADTPGVGQKAPDFTATTHDGKTFRLAERKGKWTVLFFYPKAETPGCTKQVCAFRDGIKKIRDLGAEVYGLSSNDVAEQAAFHAHHKLNFTLLADPHAEIIRLYGTKMFAINYSKRWTFIIDDKLTIRSIDKDVDPVMDAAKVAATLHEKITKP